MDGIVFIVVAVGLYFVADRILNAIELHLGRRLQSRGIVFFVLLLGLALMVFPVLRKFLPA